MSEKPDTILVTGALGNLGWKALCHLARHAKAVRLVGIDRASPGPEHRETLRQLAAGRPGPSPRADIRAADLTDWDDAGWREPMRDAAAVVHFASQNPVPEATWNDVAASIDMTANLVAAAGDGGVRRFVFASSSHVMGRYKDDPGAAPGPGQLTTDLEPGVGAVWDAGVRRFDSTPYASQKLAGERMCRTLARRSRSACTVVCLRIGWCQAGPNSPETLSAAGTPTLGPVRDADGASDPEVRRAERWFRGMWLSNRDFERLVERAVEADGTAWPEGFVVVNGMSRNRGMRWSLEEGRRWLQWEPTDGIDDGP